MRRIAISFLIATALALTAASALAQVPGGDAIVIGSTPIVGGTNGWCLYDNAGKAALQACTATPTGAAGGDLGGTYPNPTVAGLSHVTNGSLANSGLANSTLTIAGHSVALGASQTLACGDLTNAGTACQAVAPANTAAVTHNFVTSYTAATGAFGLAQPAVGDISGFGANVAAALGIDIGSAGAPVLFNGAGGTPSSLVGTNISGTAASLTAGHVTTNANLTGDVTSSGNATTLASVVTAGGPIGSATVAPIITYDAKGRLTAVSSATVTPAVGSITGLGAGAASAFGAAVNTNGGIATYADSGTWTPTDVSGAGLVLTVTDANYVKIANVCTVSGSITYPTTVSGVAAVIGGLPCTAKSGTSGTGGGAPSYSNSGLTFTLDITAGNTVMQQITTSGTGIANSAFSGKLINFTLTYITN